MTDDERDLATQVDAVAGSVEGVSRVYPAGMGRAARRVVGDHPLSTVRMSAGVLEVDVSIGVSADPAEVGARVSEAVHAALQGHPVVRVRILRVS